MVFYGESFPLRIARDTDSHSPANRFLFFRIACCPNNCHLIERLIATVLTNLTRFLFFL
jgi:hypothetical protein